MPSPHRQSSGQLFESSKSFSQLPSLLHSADGSSQSLGQLPPQSMPSSKSSFSPLLQSSSSKQSSGQLSWLSPLPVSHEPSLLQIPDIAGQSPSSKMSAKLSQSLSLLSLHDFSTS